MKATGLSFHWKMAMGRGLRAFHINPQTNPGVGYSVILEQRGRSDVLLFENYAIASLGKF